MSRSLDPDRLAWRALSSWLAPVMPVVLIVLALGLGVVVYTTQRRIWAIDPKLQATQPT